MARTLTVFAQGKEIKFSTSFTDEHATIQLCQFVNNGSLWSNFAKDLAKCAHRGYSPKQLAWVHKLVVDHQNYLEGQIAFKVRSVVAEIFANVVKRAAREEQAEKHYIANLATTIVANVINRQIPKMSNIIPLFDIASTKLQKPKVVFWVSTNRKIKIERCGDGSLRVSDDDYGFSGYISKSGRFHLNPHSSITEIDIQGMNDIAADPIFYARKYGLGTGRCCFCNRPLCDEYSIGAGYGATCAAYRKLPYGKVCMPVKSALKL